MVSCTIPGMKESPRKQYRQSGLHGRVHIFNPYSSTGLSICRLVGLDSTREISAEEAAKELLCHHCRRKDML